MLRALSVSDIVLIDRLELDFEPGLSVLTGETGAGKSILLDALALVIGRRADAGLLRSGADKGVVAAEFSVPNGHPVLDLLIEHGLDLDGDAVLIRRTLGADGRSRAFLNDQPVSAALLRQVGEKLIEIHGQHGQQGLLNPSSHRALLDAFGGLDKDALGVAKAHGDQVEKKAALDEALASFEQARTDRDYLEHVVEELRALDPVEGEEAELADRRALMMNGEKIAAELSEADTDLGKNGGVDSVLRVVLRRVERVAGQAGGVLDPLLDALERAVDDLAEVTQHLNTAIMAVDFDPQALEQVEERLFALRAAARKHNCRVEELPRMRNDLEQQLAAIDSGAASIDALRADFEAADRVFAEAAEALSVSRGSMAARLDRAVGKELRPLKMEKATFRTRIDRLPRERWSASGCDHVAFEVSTNPGSPFGALSKIASGGELSRFALALKVVLAADGPATTLIFDEVDQGVGGAVAAAVGDRLLKLGNGAQVLVVTHAPQVAARGSQHVLIDKTTKGGAALTRARTLTATERREEVARMLAGAEITDEARAAAERLMVGGSAA